MRRLWLILACASMFSSLYAKGNSPGSSRQGEAAGYSSRDATVLSMMGWGLGLGIGIAAFCALMENSSSSSSSNGGGGSGGHSH